jgi:hypothetical protein
LPLVTPETGEAHGGAEFPGFGLLLAGNYEPVVEMSFGFRGIRLWRRERYLAGDAMNLTLPPRFFGCFYCRHCFINAAPSVIELAEFRMSPSQIRSTTTNVGRSAWQGVRSISPGTSHPVCDYAGFAPQRVYIRPNPLRTAFLKIGKLPNAIEFLLVLASDDHSALRRKTINSALTS